MNWKFINFTVYIQLKNDLYWLTAQMKHYCIVDPSFPLSVLAYNFWSFVYVVVVFHVFILAKERVTRRVTVYPRDLCKLTTAPPTCSRFMLMIGERLIETEWESSWSLTRHLSKVSIIAVIWVKVKVISHSVFIDKFTLEWEKYSFLSSSLFVTS